jgi:hypothetical protein
MFLLGIRSSGILAILYHVVFVFVFFFLQGKKNPGTDRLSVEAFLEQVRTAKEMKIDR